MTKPDDDYLWDGSGDDPDVKRLEGLLSPLRHREPMNELRRSRRSWIIAGVAAAAAALVLVIAWPRGSAEQGCVGPGMVFTSADAVSCNGEALATGVLPIHGQLATGAHEAELTIANIGTAKLGANTIVRLDQTSIGKRHQLFLQEGTMHAKVIAPPRIFAVATPSADVTDLGCEYTLEIDRTGAGSIRVLTGRVELETGTGAVVLAPAGTRARLLPGRRASLPVVDNASPEMTKAVAELEAGQADAIDHLLAAATKVDAITVANLARMVGEADRRRVLETLATLVPPPACASIAEVLASKDLLEIWYDHVYLVQVGAFDATPSNCAQ
jgi:hypothetical protein